MKDNGDMTVFRDIANGKMPIQSGYCGVCGKRVVTPSAYGWLCPEHGPKRNNSAGCEGCQNELTCMLRVMHGLWVVCEMPSKRDIDLAIQRGYAIDNPERPILADVHIGGTYG